MSKARLANEPETRTATDPVTGVAVDKSKAVIGREANGKVHARDQPCARVPLLA